MNYICSELRFQPGYCSHGKFQLGYRYEQGTIFQVSSLASNQAGVFTWENFYPSYRDLGRKERDLINQANPPSHMNTLKLLQRKEW